MDAYLWCKWKNIRPYSKSFLLAQAFSITNIAILRLIAKLPSPFFPWNCHRVQSHRSITIAMADQKSFEIYRCTKTANLYRPILSYRRLLITSKHVMHKCYTLIKSDFLKFIITLCYRRQCRQDRLCSKPVSLAVQIEREVCVLREIQDLFWICPTRGQVNIGRDTPWGRCVGNHVPVDILWTICPCKLVAGGWCSLNGCIWWSRWKHCIGRTWMKGYHHQ